MIRRAVRGFGELLLTCGLVVLLFAAYEVYGKEWQVNAEQNQLDSALDQQWSQEPPVSAKPGTAKPAAKPVIGKGMARLYIPRLGKQWVVVEGIGKHDIALAPGHYPKSQLPGQVGNFAVAGHRARAIFLDLDQMAKGDKIIVQTQEGWHVYTVDKIHIITPNQVGVVAANPDQPGAAATEKYLTLTTCNPKWDNYQRLVVRAKLTSEQPLAAGRPVELKGA